MTLGLYTTIGEIASVECKLKSVEVEKGLGMLLILPLISLPHHIKQNPLAIGPEIPSRPLLSVAIGKDRRLNSLSSSQFLYTGATRDSQCTKYVPAEAPPQTDVAKRASHVSMFQRLLHYG